jgi:hypothetical protein
MIADHFSVPPSSEEIAIPGQPISAIVGQISLGGSHFHRIQKGGFFYEISYWAFDF